MNQNKWLMQNDVHGYFTSHSMFKNVQASINSNSPFMYCLYSHSALRFKAYSQQV